MQKNFFNYFLILLLYFACNTQIIAENANEKSRTLSLHDAILLAVRTNPNIQQSQLNNVMQKFNLHVEEWQFEPHYSLKSTGTVGKSRTSANPTVVARGLNVQPAISLLTAYGTQFKLEGSNQETKHYNPGLSLQISQPLMRGFGRPIVEAAINNARDSEFISKLNIENALRGTVTAVINAYLNLLMAESSLELDQNALLRSEKSVTDTRYFIKAGHKAGNELVTVLAEVANAKTAIERDKNNLRQARYSLLSAIGVDPNSEIEFTKLDIDQLIKKYHLLSLDETKTLILENDIQYQIDQITLHGSTSRALLTAIDNTRWQLGLTANINSGGGVGGGRNAGINSLFNGANQGQSVGLTLEVPIDDQLAKQAVVSAKIALKEAELALMQEKWSKETNAINGWNDVVSALHTLTLAEEAEKLQVKTYNISYQKYLHGLVDSLELQTAEVQLMQSQQSLLDARLGYLKSLVNLDLLIGNTLKTWDIEVNIL